MKKHILIIDGYNVIKRTRFLDRKIDRSLRASREELISIVAEYGLRKSFFDEVFLVFDGKSEKATICDSVKSSNIKLVYSSASVSADDEIRSFLMKFTRGSWKISVVSDDNYVTNSARAWGADVIPTKEFMHRVGRHVRRCHPTSAKPRDNAGADDKVIDDKMRHEVADELKRIWGIH